MTVKTNVENKKLLTVERVMEHLNDDILSDAGVWYYDPKNDSFEFCEEEQVDEVGGIVMPFKENLVRFSEVVEALEDETEEDFERYRGGVWHRIFESGYVEEFNSLQERLLSQRVEDWLDN